MRHMAMRQMVAGLGVSVLMFCTGCQGSGSVPIVVKNDCEWSYDRAILVTATEATISAHASQDLDDWVSVEKGDQQVVAYLTLEVDGIRVYIGWSSGPWYDHLLLEEDLEPLADGGFLVTATGALCPEYDS